jgi:Domain of Unknown Function (DUF1080)/FG-GAP-like repeat
MKRRDYEWRSEMLSPNNRKYAVFSIVMLVLIFVWMFIPTFAGGPVFRADYIFTGSELTGWTPFGQADWKAENGVITGTPKSADGGWLVLNKSIQNTAVYSNVHCAAGCKAGVLLRATKTPDGGLKGIYVSFSDGDLASYSVQVDAQGHQVSRNKVTSSSAPGAGVAGPGGPYIMGFLTRPGGGSPSNTPTARPPAPQPSTPIPASLTNRNEPYKPGEWNDLNAILYQDKLNIWVNGGRNRDAAGGEVGDDDVRFGPIALYAGGTVPAQFKDVRYKDLNVLDIPKEKVANDFRMQKVSDLYYSWGAQIADVNHDGIPDVIAGPYYYLGPNYTEAHEIYPPSPYNPAIDYAEDSMVDIAYDFTGDGWPDVLIMSGNAGRGIGTLYVNPEGQSRHWDHYVVLPQIGNEETLLKDIDGDGKPEVIYGCGNQVCYAKPDPKNPTGEWKRTAFTEPGPWGNGHGMGVGDINGDGRADFVNVYGWWEHPAKGSKQQYWKYHPFPFGRVGAAEIGIYDVNGDGLNDVVTGLDAHGFGLAWYEQKKDTNGSITFVEHMIMDNFLTKNAGDLTFTEPHAMTFADLDGDGIPDIITGKRAYSHLFTFADPDPLGPQLLVWYRTVRDKNAPGGARFEPHIIDNRAGVGSHLGIGDLNGDGRPDIVSSGAAGTYVFFNEIRKSTSGAKSSGN